MPSLEANIEILYEQINRMMQHDSWFIGYFVKMDVYAKIKELNCFVFATFIQGHLSSWIATLD